MFRWIDLFTEENLVIKRAIKSFNEMSINAVNYWLTHLTHEKVFKGWKTPRG